MFRVGEESRVKGRQRHYCCWRVAHQQAHSSHRWYIERFVREWCSEFRLMRRQPNQRRRSRLYHLCQVLGVLLHQQYIFFSACELDTNADDGFQQFVRSYSGKAFNLKHLTIIRFLLPSSSLRDNHLSQANFPYLSSLLTCIPVPTLQTLKIGSILHSA